MFPNNKEEMIEMIRLADQIPVVSEGSPSPLGLFCEKGTRTHYWYNDGEKMSHLVWNHRGTVWQTAEWGKCSIVTKEGRWLKS